MSATESRWITESSPARFWAACITNIGWKKSRRDRRNLDAQFMVVIRGTQKLLRWFPAGTPVNEPSTTRLGDWYGNLISMERITVALFISERSRLPVLLPARDLPQVATHLMSGLEGVLDAMSIPTSLLRAELAAMIDVRYAPTNSRSLLGTIIYFTQLLEWELNQNPRAQLLDLSLKLSETPIRTLRLLQSRRNHNRAI